jgi:hypothetical protein
MWLASMQSDLHSVFLGGLVIVVLAGLSAVQLFKSRMPAAIICLIGAALCLLTAATSELPWSHDSVWGLLVGAVILLMFGGVMLARSLKTQEEAVADLRSRLPDSDVVLPAEPVFKRQRCWVCGDESAPIRPTRLLRTILLIAGESVVLNIPVCERHGDQSQYLWSFGKKSFSLVSSEPEKGIVVVRFADPQMAHAVKDDLDGDTSK